MTIPLYSNSRSNINSNRNSSNSSNSNINNNSKSNSNINSNSNSNGLLVQSTWLAAKRLKYACLHKSYMYMIINCK